MNETTTPTKPPVWQRHRGLVIGAVVFVVLLVTVISDLPVSTSRADDISAERSVMSEVNTDLAGCALAIHQAIGIWDLQAAHQLTAADRAPTPGLLERRPDRLLVHQRGHLRPDQHSGPRNTGGKIWDRCWRPRHCGRPRTLSGPSRTCRR